jgi:hypothetical protein
MVKIPHYYGVFWMKLRSEAIKFFDENKRFFWKYSDESISYYNEK